MTERHPSMEAWRPDIERMARRVAERLAGEGCGWPELAAAALTTRGIAGLDRRRWARVLGLDYSIVEGLEEGRLSPEASRTGRIDAEVERGITEVP